MFDIHFTQGVGGWVHGANKENISHIHGLKVHKRDNVYDKNGGLCEDGVI